MANLFSKRNLFIGLTFLLVFLLHTAQYLIGSLYEREEGTQFTPFAYKAPFSLSEDNLNYAASIGYASNNPTFYRTDNTIKENKGLYLPDGNVVINYMGAINNLLGDINLTYYFGSVIPLLLSVVLIFKIVELFFNEHSIPISIGVLVVILCSNFDDFLGLGKFLTGFIFTENYNNNFLVLGYSQRFPYCQCSIFLFLFWLFQFFKHREDGSIKRQIFLLISIAIIQYAYFYYWTYAIAITTAMIFFDKRKITEYLVLVIGYLFISAPFWIELIAFNNSPFLEEYQEKIKGEETFPLWGIIVLGTICLTPYLKFGKRMFNALLVVIPIVIALGIEFINYTFQPFHPLYMSMRMLIPLSLISLGIIAWIWNKWDNWAILSLLNYYLIFFLCSLKFVIGFNVQPYHWVYASYFPLLIINLIVVYKDVISVKWVKNASVYACILVVLFGLLNSFKSADKNHAFWTIQKDDVEVIDFLNKYPEAVIGGNNIMPLITFTAHAPIYLYGGTTCNKRSSFHESCTRFIEPYKQMGYSDSLILNEYMKYEEIGKYHNIFISNDEATRDSLAKVYPDNILGSIETISHYFTSPAKYLDGFKEVLNYHNDPGFEINFLLVYKPTFRGHFLDISGRKVLENSTYIIYSL